MKNRYNAPIESDLGMVTEAKVDYSIDSVGLEQGANFRYADHKNASVLVGAYREEKNQLSWIIGENPCRYEKLYNVRINESLFSMRNGGITTTEIPDFILIYNYQNVAKGYHLFPCISSSVRSESEMSQLKYPSPNGSYVVYLLGSEIQSG